LSTIAQPSPCPGHGSQHAAPRVAAVETETVRPLLRLVGLTNRSAIAFAFGARTGVFTIRMPSLRGRQHDQRLSNGAVRKREAAFGAKSLAAASRYA
jgi:hypothetical protein